MRKFLLGLALLAPSFAAAQTPTPVRGQRGYDTGVIVNCTALDGSGAGRCLVPGYVQYDGAGNIIGTSTNPIATSNSPDSTGTGTLALATSNATYVIPLANGKNAVGLTISGLTGSGATITVERSNDWNGTTGTWTNANTTESSATSSLSATITANGQARVGVAGAQAIRLRVSAAGTGTATIAYSASTAAGPIFLTSTLPGKSPNDTLAIGNVGIVGSNSFSPTQVSVGTTATLLVAQRQGRQRVVTYLGAANACYVGNAGVTATTGFPIGSAAGQSAVLNTQAAIYAVCAATTTVSVDEEYN